ncbi:MAG: hypothetical protein ACHQJX_12845, partial [Candidatus Acidiferrales bacterium]
YDALVADDRDNILVAITGQTGNGIAIIDLSSLGEPPPLPYAATTQLLPMKLRSFGANRIQSRASKSAKIRGVVASRSRIPHIMNKIAIARRTR